MTDNLSLYDCLQQVSLEKYHGRFSERGVVDVNGLMSLTMQDYPSLGISTMSDRQNLFRLIQSIKTMRPPAQTKRLCTGKIYGRNTPQEDAGFKGKDKKSGAKRPREATENSPVAVKIKTKMDDKIKTETHRRLCLSRSAESIPSTGFYNYGVPTTKPNHSAIKRHQSASALYQSRIQVCVRKRPLTQAELHSTEEDVVNVTGRNTVELSAPKVAVDLTKYVQKHQFVFDEVFDQSCSNKEVYERTAKPLMDTLFNRGKATCFAYGCTGSGKTFTMLGNQDVQGIYILAASEIFSTLHSGSHGKGLGLWVSFYEIYCGQLFDLLDGRSRLFAREDASHQVCIAGLTEQHIHNVEELMEVIEYGGGIRSTGATGVNADSSRSHAILQLELKVTNSKEHFGRFSFIDLAGCERAADVTDNDKQTRMEGAEINQSLLALKECIRALDLDSRHTPFRQSKLTQVLKDSFVGNSQTCMIANISPIKSCSENTLNTLRYADRVKELKKDMPSTPGTPSPRPFTVPAPVQDTERLSPVKKSSSMTGKKITNTSIPRLEVQLLKPTETSGHFKNSLKKLKMTDINGNVRPSTSSTQTLSLPKTKNPTATRTSGVSSSVDVSPSTGRSNVKKRLMAKESQRPKTSPDVLTITSQVESNRTQSRSRNSKRKPVNINTRSISRLTGAVPEEPKIRPPQTGELKVTDDVTEEVLLMNSTTNCSGKFNVGSSQGSSPRRDFIQCESVPALRVDRLGSVHDKGPKETSPLSRNNRYGIGIKTRLAKLFTKGNTEDKGVEPKIENNEEHPPYQTHKQLIHMPTAVSTQEGCHLTLMQEQFVASHHTQLAMVTGLCHEEMVLLKQINNGQKDFKDYVAHLDEILTKKVACIESLQEKLPR